MPTASEIATELRRVADRLETAPDLALIRPSLNFYHGSWHPKEKFIALAKVFPRPLEKGDGYNHDQIVLTHAAGGLIVTASIERAAICTLVEPARPAVYECAPLLSLEEEAALGPF